MEIETIYIKSDRPPLEFYAWRCLPCGNNGSWSEWVRCNWATKSACPYCGNIVVSDPKTVPKGFKYFKGWLLGLLAYPKSLLIKVINA